MEVWSFADEGAWVEAALAEFRAATHARASGHPTLSLCLAGGRSPEPVYRAMAGLDLEGTAVELWLGDERVVGRGESGRNDLMIERAFADCLWKPRPRLRPWPIDQVENPTDEEAELVAEAAAKRYEEELRLALGPEPSFDLAILGLGADGHTASLFPATPEPPARAPGESPALAFPSRSPISPYCRVTLSFAALASARRRLFLVRGEDKLHALRLLEIEDPSIPASRLAGPRSLALYLR